MQKYHQSLLQAGLLWIGIIVATFLLWEPHLEGRNVGTTLFQIYFQDLFLAYVYIASLPFFLILYKAVQLLEYKKKGQLLQEKRLKALATIQYLATVSIGLVILGEIALLFTQSDDRAGGVFMGVLAMSVFLGILGFSEMLKRKPEALTIA